MHDITRDFLVSIAAFATVFGIIYIIVITRYRERMSMLEKGIDASAFKKSGGIDTRTLKVGMVCIGIALGLLTGDVLYKNDILDRVAYFSMVFLFGGISLIANFVIERKLKP